jgi:phosphatidylserine/phosphatidylglycerophosphate/cardiolipin synthase-like enzyme
MTATATPTTAGRYTFLATDEYLARLTNDISQTQPGDRVLLATMAYNPAIPAIERLTHELCQAAKRHVDVKLSIDAYNFLVSDRKPFGPLVYRKQLPVPLPKHLAPLDKALTALRQAGADVVVTNMPTRAWTMPFAGRSHAKISIVNDTVYLGSNNLEKPFLEAVASWQDSGDAAWLYNLFGQRFLQSQTRLALGDEDLRHRISSSEEILFDVGVPKQSRIYDQALALIDRAQQWLFISCQYFPNSTTAQHLKRAHQRGVTVIPMFNHYKQHSGPHRLLQEGVTRREQLRMPPAFFDFQLPTDRPYLHAKILASEQEALLGSHNFIPAGVNFGTAEIAIHSTAPNFGKAAANLLCDEAGIARRF